MHAPGPDARRGVRRGQRDPRRHRRGDALGGDGGGRLPARGGAGDGPDRPGDGERTGSGRSAAFDAAVGRRAGDDRTRRMPGRAPAAGPHRGRDRAWRSCAAAELLHAPLIVCFTSSGFTARKVAAYRPTVPILAVHPGARDLPPARAGLGRDPGADRRTAPTTTRCSRVARQPDPRARAGPAGRPGGGDRRRSLRRAGHHQPAQDRSRCSEHAAHLPRHRHLVRRAADRLRLRRLPLRPTRATGAPAPARWSRPAARRLLIDTPPELRLQLLAGGLRPASTRCSTPTSTPITSTASTTCGSSRCAQRRPLPVLRPGRDARPARARLPLHLRRRGPAYEGTSKPQLELHAARARARRRRSPASEVLPLAFQHGHLRVFGYRIGPLAYLTDVKAVARGGAGQLAGLEVLVLNALWWRPHPTHLSIAEAVETARALGRRAHLSHPPDARDRARRARGAAARRHRPGLRRTHGGGRLMKLRYGRMLAGSARRRARTPARPARRAAPRASARCRRRSARRRAAGEYGFYGLGGPGADGAADHAASPRGWARPTTTSWCSASAARRSAPRRCSPRSAAGVERAGTTRGGSSSRGSPCSTTSIPTTVAAALAPDRPAAGAGQRDQQVGRHRRDDGAVPGGARVARGGAGQRGAPPPGVHHRSGEGRAARDRHARGDRRRSRCRPTSAAASACSRRWGCCPRRWSASTSRGCSPAPARAVERAESRRPAPESRRALRRAALGRRHRRSAPGIHVLMPYTDRLRDFAEWYRQLWAESLGKRVDRRGRVVTPGPRRSARSAPPTSTARCSSSWRARSTRSSPSSRWTISARTCTIPAARPDLPAELAYLAGHTLGELLSAEHEATVGGARPHGPDELHAPSARALGAAAVGELIMFFQLATGYAGVLVRRESVRSAGRGAGQAAHLRRDGPARVRGAAAARRRSGDEA